ncbi:DUF2568 domain-containing protein [Demequina gelatinilytica]|uniref:DUF2568 domain-containing protein n=1 Tax=Demequina gelatinilytica TaxID=1638980 RepID=UPI0007807ED2|nr:DUF2568 domain-containing protein [Demequina gelatinilytica]
MRWLGGGLVFIAELTMYAVLAWWPVAAIGGILGWALAFLLPIVVGLLWFVSLSPKAPRPIGTVATLVARTMLLAAGSLLYASIGATAMLWIHTAAWLVGTPIAQRWPVEPPPERRSP